MNFLTKETIYKILQLHEVFFGFYEGAICTLNCDSKFELHQTFKYINESNNYEIRKKEMKQMMSDNSTAFDI